MNSFSLSFSEEEDLQDGPDVDKLVRIANGEDADAASDLDESNTPTEQYEDDMEQGNGVTHTLEQPIIISDDSDSEEEKEDPESVFSTATVTLRPVKGTVKLNEYVFSAFLGIAALKVNIRKLSKREIDVHCKNNEVEDSREDRFLEAVNVQSSCMGSPPTTPRNSSSKSKSRLSSSKKMSTVKKGAGGRAKRSIFDVDSDSCPSPALVKRKSIMFVHQQNQKLLTSN